ncbi:hypothetical protein ACI65C_005605 [Semiaphis heraclei]
MMASLVEAVNVYNLESNSNGAAIKVLEDNNFAIAISTPLMQRVSCGLEEYGEMLFIDASGNIDRYGCKVFVIYINSCAGGLPIGTIIVTSESSSATWRYLWNSSHGVPLCHRQVLYSKVKEMLYSKRKDQLESTFNNLLHEPLVKKYLKFESYITNLYQRKKEWALCYQKELITQGQITNNISEAGMKIVKDLHDHDDVQIAFEETNANCKLDTNNPNMGDICKDLSDYDGFEATLQQFDECVDKMKRAFSSDKAYFLPAIKSFVKSMENNVKTHAGLCSAMETFGLNPKVKNPKLIGNKRIGTQPTARAR